MTTKIDLRTMRPWKRIDTLGPKRGVWTHTDLPDSKTIYRYMTIPRAIDTLRTQSFTLRAPYDWDDPYEDHWYQKLFCAGSKLVEAKAYGLCWTTRMRDEPMWRLYMCPDTPTVPAIRIRTTAGRLRARLVRLAASVEGKAFLGRVRYQGAASLTKLAEVLTANPDDQLARNAARGLHWKRSQFILEREVRLLWIVTAPDGPETVPLPFDGIDLIDQVMIGPSTDPIQRLSAYRRLRRAGVSRALIHFSTIYDPPV